MAARQRIATYIVLIVALVLYLTSDKWFSDPVKHKIADSLVGFDTYAATSFTKNAEGIFLVKAKDKVIGNVLRSGKVWSEQELSLIRQLITPKSKIIFIGAHIGTLAIPISRSAEQVIAIEPNPETFELLETNIAINKRSNIQALQIAANDRKGSLEFLVNSENTGQSKRMPFSKTYEYTHDAPRTISVVADRVDDIVQIKPDLIHMDIEGSEYFALQGMPRLLQETSYLLVEFFPRHLSGVANITVTQFLSVISPYFDHMYVPSKKIVVPKNDFQKVLQEMYDRNHDEEALIFAKRPQALLRLQ